MKQANKESKKIWVKRGYGSRKLWLEIARRLILYAKSHISRNR